MNFFERLSLSWILAGGGAALLLTCVCGWIAFWNWCDRYMERKHQREADHRRWDRLTYPQRFRISPCLRDMKDAPDLRSRS